jgi:hypothetical protein
VGVGGGGVAWGAGSTVMFVEAVLLASALLRAVIPKMVGTLTFGALNKPDGEMVPPVAVQLTPVLEEPVTVALNCWVPPATIVGFWGVTEMFTTGAGAFTVTVALAVFEESALLRAVTVTLAFEETVGAVNKPDPLMAPPDALHVTP